ELIAGQNINRAGAVAVPVAAAPGVGPDQVILRRDANAAGARESRRSDEESIFNAKSRIEERNSNGRKAGRVRKERLRAVFDAPESTSERCLTVAHQSAIGDTTAIAKIRADRIAAEADDGRGVADDSHVCRVAGGH